MNHDIVRQIREAAAFERAAGGHEDKHENTMKSAGASMYSAFAAALREQPQYQGRKIDDAAVRRIYESTTPRPWWDAYLQEAGYRKESKKDVRLHGAAFLIQWHLSPYKAAKARAEHIASKARARELVEKQGHRKTRSDRSDQVPSTASFAEQAVGSAPSDTMRALRDAASGKSASTVTVEDLLGEGNRIMSALRKVKPEHRERVLELAKAFARDVEEYA